MGWTFYKIIYILQKWMCSFLSFVSLFNFMYYKVVVCKKKKKKKKKKQGKERGKQIKKKIQIKKKS